MEIAGMVCGTGNPNLPKPGDPDGSITLTATSIFGGIKLHWTYPVTNPYAVAHTIIYRGTDNNFSHASELAIASGNTYYDQSIGDTNTLYYYWIVVVSVNGTSMDRVGPVSATANSTVSDIMVALTDRIDRGVLATSLKTQIDKITELEDGLTQEASYRVADGIALGNALTALQASIDDVTSILQNEVTARSTADSSLASQITTAQSQLGDDLASAQTTLQTNINTTNGKVTAIGALYTAKVQVNGLIGGFGVYNDGSEVQAGFDVDTFWVGRTGPDKKKPFIIDSGNVYIDNAFIHNLSADKITTGTMSAARIDTRGMLIKDASGNVILGAGNALNASYAAPGTLNSDLTGSIASAAATAVWNSVSGSGKPQDNATVGATIGVNLAGKIQASNIWTYIDTGVIGSAFIGDAAITNAKIANLEVGTLKIANNAISVGGYIDGGGGVGFYTPTGGSLLIVAYMGGSTNFYENLNVVVDGSITFSISPPPSFDGWSTGPTTGVITRDLGAGSHSVGFYQNAQAYNASRIIWFFFHR